MENVGLDPFRTRREILSLLGGGFKYYDTAVTREEGNSDTF